AILRGKIVLPKVASLTIPSVPTLRATSAWIGAAGHVPLSWDARYYRAANHSDPLHCNQLQDCQHFRQTTLNSTKHIELAGVDLSGTFASKIAFSKASELLAPGHALIIVGTDHGAAGHPPTLVAQNFFLPVTTPGD